MDRARPLRAFVTLALLGIGWACAPPNDGEHAQLENASEAVEMNDLEREATAQLSRLVSEHGDYQHAVRWFAERGPEALPFLIGAFEREAPASLLRARIAETFGELGHPGAVPTLASTLGNGELSWECARALGRIGGEEATETLIAALSDERPEVATNAIRALGSLLSEEAAHALVSLLEHESANRRYYAVQSLLEMRPSGWRETLAGHGEREEAGEVRALIEEGLGDAS